MRLNIKGGEGEEEREKKDLVKRQKEVVEEQPSEPKSFSLSFLPSTSITHTSLSLTHIYSYLFFVVVGILRYEMFWGDTLV